MNSLIAVLCGLCVLGQAAEPVVIPDATSPNGIFSIRLTHDRTKETDPMLDDVPDVQIVATASKQVLASFPFAADPDSDRQPLRTKVRAHWNADGSAVAISFAERNYTHLLVFRLKGKLAKPESFIAVAMPKTDPIIQAMIPRFKEFRSNWHSQFQEWTNANTLRYADGTSALIHPIHEEDPNVMARYSFTVDISDPTNPVIKKIERIGEE